MRWALVLVLVLVLVQLPMRVTRLDKRAQWRGQGVRGALQQSKITPQRRQQAGQDDQFAPVQPRLHQHAGQAANAQPQRGAAGNGF